MTLSAKSPVSSNRTPAANCSWEGLLFGRTRMAASAPNYTSAWKDPTHSACVSLSPNYLGLSSVKVCCLCTSELGQSRRVHFRLNNSAKVRKNEKENQKRNLQRVVRGVRTARLPGDDHAQRIPDMVLQTLRNKVRYAKACRRW